MTAATRALAALVVAAAGACFNPQYDQPSCRMTGECPAGLRCDGEVCRLPADLIDAAVDAEAIDAIDAPDGGCVPISERCDGLDDDCDQRTDETFPTLGTACDGPDGDVCVEGAVICRTDGSGVECNDQTPTIVELCNGADDDCDANTDEGFPLGQACDGVDGDACAEGVLVCNPTTGGTQCNDMTSTLVETCNVLDDDCDVMVDEGFDLANDIANCGMCGRVCTNSFGSNGCSGSTCMPICSAGAQDCDGNPVTGCELRNTNPVCAGAMSLGSLRGDAGTDTVVRTGFSEAFFRLTVSESLAGSTTPILAQVTLTSPPGTNFDLFVTCASCGGPTVSSTTTGVDTVNIGRTDAVGLDSTFDMLIEVRWTSSTACGNWSLSITGNVPTTNRACD